MWFAMPLLWSVIAVSIAQELNRPALPIGNALEARVMKHVLERKTARQSAQLRGMRKLANVENGPKFQKLVRPGVYVVQPIRLGMIQPLVDLGFVTGSRYSAFCLAAAGERLLELPAVKPARYALLRWAQGENPRDLGAALDSLSPLTVPDAASRKLIRSQLLEGGSESSHRRRDLANLGIGPSQEQLDSAVPLSGISVDHWRELRAGAGFIELQQAALSVLSKVDERLHELRDKNKAAKLSLAAAVETASDELALLKAQARRMENRIKAGNEKLSIAFLHQCLTLSPLELAAELGKRDGSVVALRGDVLTLGPAGVYADAAVPRVYQPDAKAPFAPQLVRLKNLSDLIRNLNGEAEPRRHETQIEETA
ncbi:hypothetical protein [Paracoccus marcusii]|uniref:hypothetical protein n=1 Tax=Paracoccus marcusii TaxID=59779 RepID=UPI003262FB63